MADAKWVKIQIDMFDHPKLKIIDSLENNNLIHYIWTSSILLAGRSNKNGELYLSEDMPYTLKTLAIAFRRTLDEVRKAYKVLIKLGMIEVTEEKAYRLKNWQKYQNVDGLDKIRKQTNERVARYRERKREEKRAAEAAEDKNFSEEIEKSSDEIEKASDKTGKSYRANKKSSEDIENLSEDIESESEENEKELKDDEDYISSSVQDNDNCEDDINFISDDFCSENTGYDTSVACNGEVKHEKDELTVSETHQNKKRNKTKKKEKNTDKSKEKTLEKNTNKSVEKSKDKTIGNSKDNNLADSNDENVDKTADKNTDKKIEGHSLSDTSSDAFELSIYCEKITGRVGILDVGSLNLAVNMHGKANVKKAIDKSIEVGKINMPYISGILKNWRKEGYPDEDDKGGIKYGGKYGGKFNDKGAGENTGKFSHIKPKEPRLLSEEERKKAYASVI